MFGILAAAAAAYVAYQAFLSFQPGDKKVLADLTTLKLDLKEYIASLATWDREDFGLLSLNQIKRKRWQDLSNTVKGIIISIYQEPMIAYIHRQYLSSGKSAVLYARNSQHEWVFRVRTHQTEISMDGRYLGTLKEDGGLYDASGRHLIAKMQPPIFDGSIPVLMEKGEVGHLIIKNTQGKVNPRVFEMLKDLSIEEEQVTIALAIIKITGL